MNPRRVEITLDQLTWDRLEAARLREPRASFVKRALESALSVEGVRGGETTSGLPRGGGQAPSAKSSREAPSASSRASEAPTTFVEAAKRATLPPGVKTAREVLSDGVAAVDRAAAFRRASQRGKS